MRANIAGYRELWPGNMKTSMARLLRLESRHDGLGDDAERIVQIAARMFRRDRAAKPQRTLRNGRVIGDRDKQTVHTKLMSQLIEKLAVRTDNDRHDLAVGLSRAQAQAV